MTNQPTRFPLPPRNVRITRADGAQVSCTPRYARTDIEGTRIWDVDQVYDPAAGDELTIDEMPPRTGLRFTTPAPSMTRGERLREWARMQQTKGQVP